MSDAIVPFAHVLLVGTTIAGLFAERLHQPVMRIMPEAQTTKSMGCRIAGENIMARMQMVADILPEGSKGSLQIEHRDSASRT